MAKTKKQEKIVDLSKPSNISKEHLEKMQNIVGRINQAQLELGIAECRKHSILHYVAGVNDELTLLQDEVEKEYGTNDIDIKDGTINYPENGEANKKE